MSLMRVVFLRDRPLFFFPGQRVQGPGMVSVDDVVRLARRTEIDDLGRDSYMIDLVLTMMQVPCLKQE